MSTFLQLLRLMLWTLPMQRVCTVMGFGGAFCLAVINSIVGPRDDLFTAMLMANMVGGAPVMLMGGILWRAVSAQRTGNLAPLGRARLLAAGAGVVVTIGLWWVLCYALFFAALPPRLQMGLPDFAELFYGLLTVGILAGLVAFFSSRSPLAMLVTLVVGVAGLGLAQLFGPDGAAYAWAGYWNALSAPAVWLAFGIWYLRTRFIRPPGWLLPGGQSVFAAVALADATGSRLSQRAALERMLLGGTSAARLLAQWLLIGGLLLVLLLLMGRSSAEYARSVAHMTFAALLLCPVIVAALSKALVRQSRALWLPSGFSRSELFAYVETALLKLSLGMALVFTTFLLVLWFTQPWRPATSLPLLLAALFVSTLLFAYPLLMRPDRWTHGRVAVLVLVVVLILTRSFVNPLLGMTPVGTWWSPAIGLVAIVALRELARRRWQVDDLPRVATSPAS